MADLIITKAALDDSVAKLTSIHDELSHQKSDERELNQVYGQHDLWHAMHDFSGDWKIHRNKINDNVGKLKESLEKELESWTGTEQNLADAITTDKQEAS